MKIASRILLPIIAVCVILLAIPLAVSPNQASASVHYTHEYENGVCQCGEYEQPDTNNYVYQIENAGQYLWLVDYINANSYYTAKMEFTADLDFDGLKLVPINIFKGSIDGKGHKIKNVYYYAENERFGLINRAQTSVSITNLILDSSNTIGGYGTAIGGLIAYADDGANLTITNVGIEATFDFEFNSSVTTAGYGAFIGYGYLNNPVTFTNCYFAGSLQSTSKSSSKVKVFNGDYPSYSRQTYINCYINPTTNMSTGIDIWSDNTQMSFTNCYALTGRVENSATGLTIVNANEFANGKVAYSLGSPYGQEIGVDPNPVLGKETTIYVGDDACGAEYSNNTHSYDEWSVNDSNTEHFQKCTNCDFTAFHGEHEGGAPCLESGSGICTICSFSYGEGAVHSFNKGILAISGDGHAIVCDNGCGVEKEDSYVAHTYSYVNNNDGTHTASCECGSVVTTAHDYTNVVCDCGDIQESKKLMLEDCQTLRIDESYVDYYYIDTSSKYKWFLNNFSSNYNEFSTAKLYIGADITTTEALASTESKPYKGAIDGNGSTINFNHTVTRTYGSLLGYVTDVTVRNININANLSTAYRSTATLFGVVNGTVSVDKVFVNTVINATEDVYYASGLASTVANTATFNISNVILFATYIRDGWIYYHGGFVATNNNVVNISNSYVNFNWQCTHISSSDVVCVNAREVNVDNVYYYANKGTSSVGAIAINEEDFASGKLAAMLGKPFGQNIDNGGQTEDYPIFSNATVYMGYDSCGENDISNVTHSVNGEWIWEDGYHYQTCSNCDEKAYYAQCKGTVSTCTELGICATCNHTYGELTHDYQPTYNETDHYEECSYCQDKINVTAHDYTSYVKSEEGHVKSCSCGHSVEESHTFVDGFCACGLVTPATLITSDNYSSLGTTDKYVGYYAIKMPSDFVWAINYAGNNTSLHVKMVLLDDLTFASDYTFVSITTTINLTLDGNGHSVSGITTDKQYFIYGINDVTIKNISFFNFSIVTSDDEVGVFSRISNTLTMQNVVLEGKIQTSYHYSTYTARRAALISSITSGSIYLDNVVINVISLNLDYALFGDGTPKAGYLKNVLSLVQPYSVGATPEELLMDANASNVLKLFNVVSFAKSTEADIASGRYAYLINKGNANTTIGQKLGVDAMPIISTDKVYCDGTQYTNVVSTCTEDVCSFCQCENTHTHEFLTSFDSTHHFNLCACGYIDESTKVEHTFTDLSCSCGYNYQPIFITSENIDEYGLTDSYIGYVAASSMMDFDWISKKVRARVENFNIVLLNDIVANENVLNSAGALNSSSYNVYSGLGYSYYNSYYYFSGTIDGNGYSIKGLYTNDSDGGFVSHAKDLTIKNITLEDFYFAGSYASAIVNSANNVVIDNVVMKGTVVPSYDNRAILINTINGNTITISDSLFAINNTVSRNVFTVSETTIINVENTIFYTARSLCTYSSPLNIYNSYKIGSRGVAYQFLEEDFANGRVAYVMLTREPTLEWGQKIGTDPYPVKGGPKVYCNGSSFTNMESTCAHLGYCDNCGNSNPPTLTFEKYDVDGDGYTDEVYEIGTFAHLRWFSTQVNEFGNTGINAILTNNIALNPTVLDESGKKLLNSASTYTTWTPIGNARGFTYTGIFDGNNFAISGLYKNNENDSNIFGLFGYVDSAIIKNLTINDSYLKAYGSIGVFAGQITNSTIDNCHFDGYVYSHRSPSGGIVHTANDSFIQYSSVSGNGIFCQNSYSSGGGAIAAILNNSTIDSCLVAIKITYTTYTAAFAGQATDSTIINSINFSNDTDYAYQIEGTLTLINNAYKASERTDYNGYTESDFASGLVAYEISKYNADSVWGQTIGVDTYPIINGSKVYCNGTEFTNTESTCSYVGGKCANCNSYSPAHEGNYDLDGDGISEKAFIIDSVNRLLWFASYVNMGNYDANAVLTVNLYLGGINFMPIGAYSPTQGNYVAQYSGIFDGKGNAIANLNVDVTTDYTAGLFGRVVGGTIKNLGIQTATIKNTTSAPSGILAGELIDATIDTVYVSGSIDATNAYGLSATASGTTINNVITTYAGLTVDAESVTNGYYINNKAIDGVSGTFVTVNEMRSGKYAYILNGNSSVNVTWRQTLGTDLYPTFNGATVYLTNNCYGENIAYSNTASEIVHVYDGVCDNVCNNPDCMYERVVSTQHVYDIVEHNDTHHWEQCSECGYRRDITQHVYDNDCDTLCNEVGCNYTREVEDHVFVPSYDETHHFIACQSCGLLENESEKYPHAFDNVCDATCNEQTCAYVRSVPDHDYQYFADETQHAYACSYCGTLDKLEDHTFVNGICACEFYQVPTEVDGYYQIANAGNLLWFANYVNEGNVTANAKFVSNVNLQDIEWTPIGKTSSLAYKGTFDGNGYEIANFTYTLSDTYYMAGIFGYTQSATIRLLGLKNANVTNTLSTSGESTGMLVGFATDTYIYNVYAYGVVNATNATYVGGIVGRASNSAIENCITSETKVLGYNSSSVIYKSYVTSDFSSEQLSGGYATMQLNTNGNKNVWKQTIGGDAYPILRGSTVYPVYNNCGHVVDGYSNVEDTDIPSCDYDHGICVEVSGETHYKAATLNGNYYEIKTVTDLLWFNNFVNSGNYNANAILMADIDLSGYDWTPLAKTRFYSMRDGFNLGYSGTFDGNNHVVTNVDVVGESGSVETYGFFGTLSGTVKNFGIENFIFAENGVSKTSVGSIAGLVLTGGKLIRTYAVNVTIYLSDGEVGGLVGALYGGTIDNSYTHALTLSGSAKGGLVGVGVDTNNTRKGTVTNSYSDMSLYGYWVPTSSNSSKIDATYFTTGEATYLFNGDQSVITWYQNLSSDLYPKLSGMQVYRAYVYCGDAMWYTNIENADYQEPQNHVFGEDGICRQVEGELHYEPTELNEDGYYEINNVGNYLYLVEDLNANQREVNVILMADIDLSPYGTVMISKFSGIFEGNNHKIIIDFVPIKNETVALMDNVSNATIRNLTISGNLRTSYYHNGPLAGSASNAVRVENCIIDVDIVNTYGGVNDWTGGVIGSINYNATTISFVNVLYIGSISGKNSYGGFVSLISSHSSYYPNVSIVNSVCIIENHNAYGNGISTIIPDTSGLCIDNVYYLNKMGSVQNEAIQISAEDVTSGKLAYLLNGKKAEGPWKQTIGTDAYPNFTGKAVYATGENCTAVTYTNTASTVSHAFNSDGVCPCGKYTPAVLNENNVYEISTIGQLFWFAEFVNAGNVNVDAILLNDLDLDGYKWTPIGIYESATYLGTFDGNSRVLSNVTIARRAPENEAQYVTYGIFGNISGTVKNLGVDSIYFDYVLLQNVAIGGIAGRILNQGLVTDCYVTNAEITMNVLISRTAYLGGIVGYSKVNNSVVNCITYNNTLVRTNYGEMGGVLGCYDTGVYYVNCYSDYGLSSNRKGGEYATSIEKFASGEIAYLLNGSTSLETNVWGQILGASGDPYPQFSKNSALVYYRQTGGCTEESFIYGYANDSENVISHTDSDSNLVCDYCGNAIDAVKMVTGDLVQYFSTVADAIKVATSGSVITLTGSVTESFTIPSGVTLVVNNGITLTFDEIVNNGVLKLIGTLSGNTLSGNGQFYLSNTTEVITEDNVRIKDSYVYAGKDLSEDVKVDAYLGYEIMGVEFILDNWTETFEESVINVGTYNIVFTKDGTSTSITASFEVTKADLVVKVNAHSINYNSEPSNGGVTYEYLLGSDTNEVLGGELVYTYGEYVVGGKVGTYVISVSGLTSDNYNISYETGILTVTCGNPHHYDENYQCTGCGYICQHEKYTDTVCDGCGYTHVEHEYEDGYCTECGFEHDNHVYVDGICICELLEEATLVTVDNYSLLGLTEDYVGYYAIKNGYNFLWFANYAYNDREASAVLLNDIDLSNIEWVGIAKTQDYEGTIDGRNYTISNLSVTGTAVGKYGLVGSLASGATIRDLTINGNIDVNVTENSDSLTYVGLVGRSSLGSKIINVHSSVQITVNSVSPAYVGGLLAYNTFNFDTSVTYVDNSSYSGIITANGKGIEAVGGIFGFTNYSPANNIYKSVPYLTMTNTVFDGEIVSSNTNAIYVGGLVGFHRDSYLVLNNNLVLGGINVVNETHVGAIAGHIGAHQKAIESIVNNYAVGTKLYGSSEKYNDEMVDGYFGVVVDDTASLVTENDLTSGKVAYLLGDAFGQKLGVDLVPKFRTNDNIVYGGYLLCGDKEMLYSNDSSALLVTRPDHTWDKGLVTDPATCTEKGTALYTCTECGETKEESLPKTAHEYSDKWTSDDDNHWHECVCGDVIDIEEHDFDEGVVTLEPTEESTGIKVYTCSICDHELEEELAKLTHTHTYADTYSYNETSHWYASTCGHNVRLGEGEHQWNEGTVTKDASCTEEGKMVLECTVCHYSKEVAIPKTDHTYSEEWTSDSVNHWREATCGCMEVTDYGTHVINSWRLVSEQSCTTPEAYEGVCEICEYVVIRIDKPASGHSYAEEWTITDTHHYHASTCGHEDKKDYGVHIWNEGVVEKQPDCEEEGLLVKTCTICLTEKEESIPATGHEFSKEWSYDDDMHWHQATCGHEVIEDESAHVWDNGTIVDQTETTITKEYKCFCGATTQDTIDVTEHRHTYDTTQWVTSDTHHWHQATCEHTLEKSDYQEHVMIWEEISPATCSEAQKLYGYCETCGYEKEKDGKEATGHTYASGFTFDDDYHWHESTCTCGNAPITKEHHEYTWSQQTKPSCDVAEVLVGVCKCGSRVTKEGAPATGHSYSTEWTTNATHHYHSAICGHDIFPKDYAEHNFDEGKVTKETSCSAPGEMTFTCQDCQYVRKETIPQTDHVYATEWSKDLTYHWHTCVECGDREDREAHLYGEGTVTKEATCTESGIRDYVCATCKQEKTEVIPKLPHTYGEWIITDTHHYRECTCGDKANYEEHTYGQWIVVTEPTLETDGLLKKVCSQDGCNKEITKLIEHLSVDNGYTYEVNTEPTATTTGTATYTITVDGQTHVFTVILPIVEESQEPIELEEGLSGGAIAGIVIGSVFGAILIAVGVMAILWFVVKKKTMEELLKLLPKKGKKNDNDITE